MQKGTTTTMKTIAFDAFGSAPTLREVRAPTPGPGEVLVRVAASSVNPVDNAIAAGMLRELVDHIFPVTLGRDYAGTVERAGPGVTDYEAGDEVFGFIAGMAPSVGAGSWAELIVIPAGMSIVRRPATVDLAVAGAAPLAAVTALTSVAALALSQGDTLLLVGATGGVGSVAVQLAVAAGASVIAPALAEDEAYLRDLGVGEIVGRDGDVVAAVRELQPDGVDALLDLASYAPGNYDAALKRGARVASALGAAGDGPGRTNVMAMPSTDNLERVAKLLERGALTIHIAETYPLERFADAMQALATRHTLGKIALRFG
jgi:NADPH:quinone reductase-like Zn-dependent oxidoreductase